MCLLLIQINIDMVPVGGEGCRFARVSGGVVGIVATCIFFCFLWKWVVQKKQKNGSFLADAAPGRYLEPTIAVTRTETASKQHVVSTPMTSAPRAKLSKNVLKGPR